MGNMKFFEDLIDGRMLDMHVAYLAKVISTDGKTAKIQPLGLIKEYGEKAQKSAVLVDVPIIETARHTVKSEKLTFLTDVKIKTTQSNGYLTSATPECTFETRNFAILEPLKAGAIVICVCCDRDITDAKNGKNATPKTGSHSLSDSVIVGVVR